MGWWIALGIFVGLLILPLGVSVIYDAAGVRLRVVAGLIRFTIFPGKKKEKKPKKEKPKGGTKEQEKLIRKLEREIEKQEQIVAAFDPKIEAAAADYQELTRLLAEKETAEEMLMDLMEQWEAAQE
mgnify:CR=1 FL=1